MRPPWPSPGADGRARRSESPPPIGSWWPTAPAITPAPSLVLDRLQDAGNVGTILRSAAAFGFTPVVALEGHRRAVVAQVLQRRHGAHFGLRLVEGVELMRWRRCACRSWYQLARAQALHRRRPAWPCAWVMGHEGQGVSPMLEQRCA